MALRERPPPVREQKKEAPGRLPSFSMALGSLSLGVAIVSLFWLFLGRPETGGLDARWAFAVGEFNGNRAFWAFVLDLGLYSLWQSVLMGDAGAPKEYRFIPFFGLAAWLITGKDASAGNSKA